PHQNLLPIWCGLRPLALLSLSPACDNYCSSVLPICERTPTRHIWHILWPASNTSTVPNQPQHGQTIHFIKPDHLHPSKSTFCPIFSN
ncbi:hypothetical protein EDD36DRAFT_394386, partial [Exophiala viscosa]